MEKSRLATYAVGALLGISAAVVYLATKNGELTAVLATAAGTVLGYAKQHMADKPQPPIQIDDAPTKPLSNPSPNTPVICLVALGSLMLAGAAHAQAKAPQALGCIDSANAYCVVPAAAVGWQVNLKTGGAANAVSLVGLTVQHTFGSLPLGLGVYVGLGASAENRGSYQGCLGASITSWGLLCGGAQRLAGESVWQGMLTLAPQITFGGTPSYVRETR